MTWIKLIVLLFILGCCVDIIATPIKELVYELHKIFIELSEINRKIK